MSATPPVRASVTRRFDAPPERVFDAWLKRQMLGQWMFGPAVRDEEIVHLALDPRVGGSFSVMVSRDDAEVEHLGRYLEIARPSRLVFTWVVAGERAGSRVLVDIAPTDTGCELRLVHELHASLAAQVGQTEAAWNRMFDALARALT